jgi:general secretion pathway protein B
VDEAQSLGLEPDDNLTNLSSSLSLGDDDSSNQASSDAASFERNSPSHNIDTRVSGQAANKKTTPTQRLMAKDKQNSAVDRQLSQNFHRSMFMPAIDEMPSRWRLFVRPYVVLLAAVFAGFIIGFGAIRMPHWLGAGQPTLATSPANTLELDGAARENAATVNGIDTDTNINNTSDSNADGTNVKHTNTINKPFENRQADSADDLNANVNADDITPSDPDSEQMNRSTRSQTVDTADEDDSVRTIQTVNGIVLNEGETVLGYRASEDEQSLNVTSNSGANENADSNTNSKPSLETSSQPSRQSSQQARQQASPQSSTRLSSNLLNRVNQAAAQIEAEEDFTEAQNTLQDEPFVLPRPAPATPIIDLTRGDTVNSASDDSAQRSREMLRIDQLPASVLTQLPAMNFSAHMYASNPQDRWVSVNGRRLSQGDYIDDGLLIVEIASEQIVLAFKGETFSMNALSDW